MSRPVAIDRAGPRVRSIGAHAPILKYFTTVAELGTIRQASRALHVSASAINRQILNLEALIGEPVFERRRTGMQLTEAGEIVFRHCRSTLQDFARTRSEIDARHGRVTGTVQILTLDSMTVQFLPESIASFHAGSVPVETGSANGPPLQLTKHIEANPCVNGRDFVVGDVHGCFRTLEELLEKVRFEPGSDRLFSVGDLVDRGPHSLEAIEWLVDGRIQAATMGIHVNALAGFLLGRTQAGYQPWWREVTDDRIWRGTFASLPLAITIKTAHGDVGVIHAGPVYPDWTRTVQDLERRRAEAIETELVGGYEGAGATWRGKRGTEVRGARAVLTRHRPRRETGRDGNWWCIDAGAGSPGGRLTVVQIDRDPIVPAAVDVVTSERLRPTPANAPEPAFTGSAGTVNGG